MIAVLSCVALALLLLPGTRTRRRFAGWEAARPSAHRPVPVGFGLAGAGVVGIVSWWWGMGPAIAAGAVAFTAGVRWRRSRWDRSRAAESDYLLAALEVVISELRVGAHPAAAAAAAAHEAKGVAAQAFSISAARSRLGGSGADGLRCPGVVVAAELDRVAYAWRVAERQGLALAELLAATRADLSARVRFRAHTMAALAGARATAAVLAGLPGLGIALGQLMGAAPLAVLFTHPVGVVILPVGCALACLGLLWADAIIRKVLM